MPAYSLNIQMQPTFITVDCCVCGVVFAVAKELDASWRANKLSFYCPNGHSQSYTESEVDRVKRKLAEVERDRDWQKSRAETLNTKLAKEQQARGTAPATASAVTV